MDGNLVVFSGRSNRPLAEKICKHIGIGLGELHIQDYSNGNMEPNIRDSLRECDVFVVQSGARACMPTKDAASQINSRDLVELLAIIDCAKDTAARVTAVTPYAFYVRSDKKDKPHIPIAAQLMARLIEGARAKRVMAMDLHSMQAQGFYRIPMDQIFSLPRLVDSLVEMGLRDICVLATDTGGVGRARRFASFFRARVNRVLAEPIEHVPFATSEKRRFGDTERSEIINVIGGESIPGRDVVMVDDEVLGGGTLMRNAEFIKNELNPRRIFAAVTHGILSGDGLIQVLDSPIEKLIVADTVNVDMAEAEKRFRRPLDKLHVVSVADIFASAIVNVHEGRSVSSDFEDP